MILGFIGLIFVIVSISQWMDKHASELIAWAGGILLFIAAMSILRKILRDRRETPKFKEKAIVPIDPRWEPINGTFVCPYCGGSTSVFMEVNPSTACSFCGGEIPGIKDMILDRNARRQNLIQRDIENQQKDNQVRWERHLQNLNQYKISRHEQRMKTIRSVLRGVIILAVLVGIGYLVMMYLNGKFK